MTKGKIKIEITDVRNSNKKTIEQENLITNAVADFMQMWITGNLTINTIVTPIATKALGGLLLFNTELTLSASNTNFPYNNKLIGFALQSTSDNIMCGSLSSEESGIIQNGYRSVWNFGTNQCNGTIASLARTYNANPFYGVTTTECNHTPQRNGSNFGQQICYNESDNCFYMYNKIDDTHIGIYKQYQPLNKYSVTDFAARRNTPIILVNTLTVENIGGLKYQKNNDGYLYVAETQGNSSGNGTFSYQRIKYNDYSFTVDPKITITCPELLFRRQYVAISGRKAYITARDITYAYIVDLDDPTNIITLDPGTGNHFDCTQEYVNYIGTCSNGNGLFRGGFVELTGGENSERNLYSTIVYPNGEYIKYFIKKTTGTDYSIPSRVCSIGNLYKHLDIGYQGFGNTSYSAGDSNVAYSGEVFLNTDYLGTICNLASPVVKNNTQTMKITYDLIDV